MTSFKFVHFIDEFITSLGEGKSIHPSDINRYFGRPLSGILQKKLFSRISAEFVSPRVWSMALITAFPQDQAGRFAEAALETRRLLNERHDLTEPHITWHFFGESDELTLSSLSKAMKNFALRKDRTLDKYSDARIKFSGADYFTYSNTDRRGILYLKPDPACLELLNNIHSDLLSLLNIRQSGFRPHATIARLKDINSETEKIIQEAAGLWKSLEFILIPDHYILARHAGTIAGQGVFGLTAKNTYK